MNGTIPARFFAYALLFIPVTILPLFLSGNATAFVSNTYGRSYTHFELLGFSASVWLILVAWNEFRQRSGTSSEKLIILISLAFLTGFFFLTFVVEYSAESLDYLNYKTAAMAILEGKRSLFTKNVHLSAAYGTVACRRFLFDSFRAFIDGLQCWRKYRMEPGLLFLSMPPILSGSSCILAVLPLDQNIRPRPLALSDSFNCSDDI